MVVKMRIGDLLVEGGVITEKQLNVALDIQKGSGGKKLGNILVDLEIITEEQMLSVLQKKLNVPLVDLQNIKVNESVMENFPESEAREKLIFPYQLRGNTLVVATADPLDYEALNSIGAATGKNIETVLATRENIGLAINRFYRKFNIDTMASALDKSSESKSDQIQLGDIDFDEIENRVGSVPVVKFVNNLVVQAYNKRASDVHIEIYEDNMRVRFRIDGQLVEVVKLSTKAHASMITRMKIMADMDITEKRVPLDGRFSMEIDNSFVSVRVSSMPTVYGEKIVLRLMADSKRGIVPIEQLGINAENLRLLRSAITVQNGLILVTGPTGSGKSTTLYSMLSEMSTVDTNIITVEDPVEKVVPGVNQTQVNPKAGLTFAAGLRAVLRQDPDKIMIGEIRDTETADIAARAAITGHLVLASLHTNDAASSYMRLVDMGVEPFIIASSVIAVVAQRLVRLICPHCKVKYEATQSDFNFFKYIDITPPRELFKGKGCDKCEYTGNLGRTSIHEVILTDAHLRQLIVEKAKSTDIADYLVNAKNQKFLIDSAIDMLLDGKITVSEVIKLTQTFE